MQTNPLRDFFYYTKSDRRAIAVLGCIGVFCVGVLMVVHTLNHQGESGDKQVGEKMRLEKKLEKKEKTTGLPVESDVSMQATLSVFDPNTVDSLTLIRFGLKPWKVRNFLHYREAGKVFRSAEDMGNTYGWTSEDVETLLPYVRVGTQYQEKSSRLWDGKDGERKHDHTDENKSHGKYDEHQGESSPRYVSNKFQTLVQVDANTADTTTLRRIPGIGEHTSNAIVRYRSRLGGFHSVNQLMEIKMMSPELLKWFSVAPASPVSKIKINEASFQVLNAHPYISYHQTRALLQYIRLYGQVKDEKALLATDIFSQEEIDKLRPYLEY